MEYRAILRYAPMSARKVRPVVDLVRGRKVNDALETLTFIPKRAAPMVTKLIQSAIANAGQEGGVEAGELVVAKAAEVRRHGASGRCQPHRRSGLWHW